MIWRLLRVLFARPLYLWLATYVLLCHLTLTAGDCYMHNPRGSNNKLTEQANNANNQNRLFDSQNNAAGGYQVGDNCVPNCKSGNRRRGNSYDHDKAGSQEGIMYYYHGSELYTEWTVQHGCGMREPGVTGTNTHCHIVLQYMCDPGTNSFDTAFVYPGSNGAGLRDGKDPDGNRRRSGGGDAANPDGANAAASADPSRGRHENFEFYDDCRKRQRNKGLYIADQNVKNDRGATATRQNNNGNRRGLECPEERDYYPYWHPTPWRDIAVFTDTAEHCKFYREESQNVKEKHFCKKSVEGEDATPNDPAKQIPNNEQGCISSQGSWGTQPPWDIDPPECLAMPESRDNHLGNLATGKPMSYMWTVPDTIPDGSKCVLRIRYNISSGDFNKPLTDEDGAGWDPFFHLDSKYSGESTPLKNDPKKDFVGLGLGVSGPVQVQVNTAQFGRTFQDRSHVFHVRKRPDNVSSWTRIVNYNVRGRRGNIVQVYPAVEYDFVPQDVQVNLGDYLHFQWTGSDANANGNAGNGRQGTDRNNLVQIASRDLTKPVAIEDHTLFFHAKDEEGSDAASTGKGLVQRFAFLNQQVHVQQTEEKKCPTTAEEIKNVNDNDDHNCLQLNAAPAYFDGGLVEMRVVGTHHVACTRNNDFTNRSQKATIRVFGKHWLWWELLILVTSCAVFLWLVYIVACAIYALQHPTRSAFSKKNRPCLLRCPCCRGLVKEKEEVRARFKADIATALNQGKGEADGDLKASTVGKTEWPASMTASTSAEFTAEPPPKGTCTKCLETCGLCCACANLCINKAKASGLWGDDKKGLAAFLALNLFIGLVGFLINLGKGFNNWYPVAKCGGYLLDFNLSVLLLPTLRSVQTFARQVRALDLLFNSDPIEFHIRVAMCVFASTCIHVLGHIFHMAAISSNLTFMPVVTPRQAISGRLVAVMIFDPATRFAPFTGILILMLMMAMGLTASARIRRRTFDFARCPRSCSDFIAWFMLIIVGLLLAGFVPFWFVFKRLRSNTDILPPSCKSLFRKLGGFQIFWSVHKSWVLVYALLLVHGPQCWIWFLWPLVLLVCDRMMSKERRRTQVMLTTAELLKGNVLHLKFSLPQGFTYQAGHYVQVCCEQVNPEEWHPFTLTSAPEEKYLSVHIRCPDELDWCSAMRRRLAEKPAKALSQGELSAKGGYRVRYTSYEHQVAALQQCDGEYMRGDAIYARPECVELLTADGDVEKTWKASAVPPERQGSTAKKRRSSKGDAADVEFGEQASLKDSATTLSLEELMQQATALPKDAIRVKLDGPHGAPSELVWKHKVCLLVGAGIGVTPFASILRSLQLKSAALASGTKGVRKPSRVGELPDSVSWNPCESVYLYWLCRGQDEFEWFYDLLHDAIEGNDSSRNRIEVNLFQTGTIELSKVKPLKSEIRQHLGRPNWTRLLPEVAKAHAGDDIGVFLCGPQAIRKELERASAGVNAQTEDGTHFVVHAENF